MLSVTVGFCVGYWLRDWLKLSAVVILGYVIVAIEFASALTPTAFVFVPFLTFAGLGMGWFFSWWRKSKLGAVSSSKPDWAIGFSIFFLTDRILNHPDGLISITQLAQPRFRLAWDQTEIVRLKMYLRGRSIEPALLNSTYDALSDAISVEARLILSQATTPANLDGYANTFSGPDNDLEYVAKVRNDLTELLQSHDRNEDMELMIRELVQYRLLRNFETKHGVDYYGFIDQANTNFDS